MVCAAKQLAQLCRFERLHFFSGETKATKLTINYSCVFVFVYFCFMVVLLWWNKNLINSKTNILYTEMDKSGPSSTEQDQNGPNIPIGLNRPN